MNWVNNNKLEAGIILIVLCLALFLRVYRIDEYMTFLGDEGRDALVIKKVLTAPNFEKFLDNLPFIGPPTSVGNMYLGPLYYYMMLVPMWLFWLNPVSAAAMVALLGTATVGLIYYLSREWFGKWAAVLVAFLYTISPVNIIYSRSSWNPNTAPFFALLGILGIYFSRKKKNYLWLVLSGAASAFLIQMHYLALNLLPVLGILWLLEYFKNRKEEDFGNNFIKGTIFGVLLFLFLMSPLVIFDLNHNFMNFRAISTFFGQRETTVNLNIFNTLGRVVPIYQNNLILRFIGGFEYWLAVVLSVLIPLPLVYGIFQYIKNKKLVWPNFVLGVWLFGGIAGLSLYKQTIYDHYLGFLNPAPFLLLGGIFWQIEKMKSDYKRVLNALFVLILILTAYFNFLKSPLYIPPNRQLQKTQEIAKFVINESGGKPFNFALISEHNYDAAYQYYLELYNHKPKQVPFEITDQLFVVCEDPICQPVGHPKYEIAAFGWTTIENEKDFQGVKVFKLIHNKEESLATQ